MAASRGRTTVRHFLSSGWFVSILSVIVAFVLGAILILITGANPLQAYGAMFRGAIFDPQAATWQRQIKPITDTLTNATPLIIAGLGVGFGFRAGLFNIGGNGQIIAGAIGAIWVATHMTLPPVLHTLVAIVVAIVAGALYAGIAGLLKAKTGANEVIVTIMLNSIAALALAFLLSQSYWQVKGSNQPRTPSVPDSATFTHLLPPPFNLTSGFLLALLAVLLYWWILERSVLGFEVQAVGVNPEAARTAGISSSKITVVTMLIGGAFLGLAGANEALGTIGYVTTDVAGSIGFDAITVALLGRNKPLGTLFAGLLFGAFKAGGYPMQSLAGVPIDMVLILQSTIVLLIAAPALVRWLFHLPKPTGASLRAELAQGLEAPKAKEAQQQAAHAAADVDASGHVESGSAAGKSNTVATENGENR